jgi:hypothetical protein
MENAYSSIFTLGWIDIFNPVALSMVLILLPLVRKHWHVLIYVFGAYVAYVSASVAIFFGVDQYLITFFTSLTQKYSVAVGISLLIVGIAALTGCFLMILSLVKAIKQKKEITFEKVLFIKSVAPWFILLLSFGSTWSCIFSAFAMLAFIGILIANGIQIISAVWMISLFCIFSVIPTLLVYLLSSRLEGQLFSRIMNIIRKVMNGFCLFSIPIVLAVVAYWSINFGIGRLAE